MIPSQSPIADAILAMAAVPAMLVAGCKARAVAEFLRGQGS